MSAQSAALEVALRGGVVLQVAEIVGDPERGLELVVAGQRRRLLVGELLLVHSVAVKVVELPAAHLAGGDIVRGAVVGGDAAGDRLEMLSPVLGRVPIAVDRIEALAAALVHRPLLLCLPDTVGEGLFQRAQVGYDLVAGTLHQFGDQGVRFQPDGAAAPRWYGPRDFVALRIAGAALRVGAGPVHLLTRVGDQLSVTVRRFAAQSVQCELEGGTVVDVRLTDLACLSFAGVGAFASDLAPNEVAEMGFDGDVVRPWQVDRSSLGGPLLVGGRAHGKGLGVHSRSRLSFTVPAGVVHFWTRVGIDDSVTELRLQADADVRVLVNGKLAYEHKGLTAGQPPRDTGLLRVSPGDTVALEADFGRGRDLGDRVDWLSPVFLPGLLR